MDMWAAWTCGQHVCVGCIYMWAACMYGQHVCVGSIYMWAAWKCVLHGPVVCMYVCSACICGLHGCVRCNSDPGRKEVDGREEFSAAWGGRSDSIHSKSRPGAY